MLWPTAGTEKTFHIDIILQKSYYIIKFIFDSI